MRESASSIDAAAAAWLVRLDRKLTQVEQARLEEWLAADSRHVGALARAQATWAHVGGAKLLSLSRMLPPLAIEAPAKRMNWWLSAAAGLAGLVVALWAWHAYVPTHVSTAMGESRELHLSDGSRVTLGMQSSLSLDYQFKLRRVQLEAGEASFKVAKDPDRPFVVQAGNVRVSAVGTEFEVRRGARDVDVTVTEGAVDVVRDVTAAEPPVRMSAGRRISITPGGNDTPRAITEGQHVRPSEWTTRVIDFNGQTLEEAAAELNRYNQRTVVIADPALATRKIIGRFRATDPLAFANAAAAMLDAHVRTEQERLVLEPNRRLQK